MFGALNILTRLGKRVIIIPVQNYTTLHYFVEDTVSEPLKHGLNCSFPNCATLVSNFCNIDLGVQTDFTYLMLSTINTDILESYWYRL